MQATRRMTYACKAAAVTALGGRCRNEAASDGFCHNPHRSGDDLAMAPKMILLHLWMSNRRLHDEVKAAGFYIRDRSIIYTQQKHAAESALLRRSFEAYRPLGDTGVSVFGKPPVERVVRMDSLVREFVDAGFSVDGVPHGENATDGGKQGIRLVVKFRHRDLDQDVYPRQPGAMDDVQRRFYWKVLGACWVKVHVWDNVPKYYVQHEGQTLQFQLAKELNLDDVPVPVHVLHPRMEYPVNMDRKLFGEAVRFATSTVNCRIPFKYDAIEDGMTELSYNDGSWACHEAA